MPSASSHAFNPATAVLFRVQRRVQAGGERGARLAWRGPAVRAEDQNPFCRVPIQPL
jgi:hypothetical protein